jgi:hypothetical protein
LDIFSVCPQLHCLFEVDTRVGIFPVRLARHVLLGCVKSLIWDFGFLSLGTWTSTSFGIFTFFRESGCLLGKLLPTEGILFLSLLARRTGPQ